MSTSPVNSQASLRDALYELAVAAEPPTAAVLDDLVRRYPEHAAALTEMAIDLALGAADDDGSSATDDDAVSPMVSRAMSRFQNRLHQLQARTPAEVPNALAGLDRVAMRSLTQRLDVTPVFMMKLRDRHIRAETIPRRFSEELAKGLEVPLELVLADLAAAPGIHGVAHFKADRKPEAGGQQTFEDAVKSSGLSPDQQARLLRL